MEFTYGTFIAVAAALVFYLRLIILQRQKVKKLSSSSTANQKKSRRSANLDLPGKKNFPELHFSSPYLLGLGIFTVILGAVLAGGPWFTPEMRSWWWVPVTLGIILMSLVIR
jgi:hypothetical protein